MHDSGSLIQERVNFNAVAVYTVFNVIRVNQCREMTQLVVCPSVCHSFFSSCVFFLNLIGNHFKDVSSVEVEY
jgi:hypothetical protein